MKLGMAPVQREGMEYEFTVFFDSDQAHNARASKDRTNLFKDEIFTPDEKIGERILAWLNSGEGGTAGRARPHEGQDTLLPQAARRRYDDA